MVENSENQSATISDQSKQIQFLELRIKHLGRALKRAISFLDDREAIDVTFFSLQGYVPDLQNPKTFSEKVQYRKLYEPNPRFATLSDKIAVKPEIESLLGPAWVTPSLWEGDILTAEVLSAMAQPVVVKANHGSGLNLFFRPGSSDIDEVVAQANSWSRPRPRTGHRNWVAGQVERRLLIEPDFSQDGVVPSDIKLFTFGGQVKAIQVDSMRFSDHRRDFYTAAWEPMAFMLEKKRSGRLAPRPRHLDQMIAAAETIGREFSFVRADFYDLPDHPRFGELTFYPGSGYDRFRPQAMDLQFGQWWP